MKCQLLFALLLTAILPVSGVQPRVVEISGKPEKIRNLEIVVENKVPLVYFAAEELRDTLKKAAGIQVPVTTKPSEGKISLILGDCPSARAAGIDVNRLPGEGYYIIRKGNRVYLAGRDDPENTPRRNTWEQLYKRGTLSAVYDFLERFTGARFFFAGPGTVIPAKDALYLPAKINIMERPDMSYRNYYHGSAAVYPGYNEKGRPKGDTLTRVRLRFSESLLYYGHGLIFLQLIQRFGETHPEYFALMPDGKRYKDPNLSHTGQLCFNSGIREEIYQDAKAFLTGKPASSRGLTRRWSGANGCDGFFNIMPQDSMYWCSCEKCAKIAAAGNSVYRNPEQHQRVSDFMWEFTCGVASRLKKEGVKGGVAQMAYLPYDKIPKCDIPDNVRIQLAIKGSLGADPEATAIIRSWYKKAGQKVTLWVYAIGKHGDKKIPGIPPMMPRRIGQFVDTNKEMIDGIFFESETEFFLSQYLNYYVAARKLWNNDLDTEALLDDHYRAMFGKGAPMMKKFYDILEENWGGQIIAHTEDSALGPRTRVPSDFQIWTEIYSPAKMKEINRLFDAALKAAAGNKGALERIRFIRQYLFAPLEKAAAAFAESQIARDSWIMFLGKPVWLRPYNGEVGDVATKVTALREKDAIVFTFDCEEPRMADLVALQTKQDAPLTYDDSDVEIMLNPSGDRKNYYQFVVNANGAITDYLFRDGEKSDISWNSSVTAQAVRRADGWSVTVKIPLKDLGKVNEEGFPVNFCRHRKLKGQPPKEIYYQWSPYSGKRGGFHAINNWGVLSFKAPAKKYLLQHDFSDGKIHSIWRSGGPKGGQVGEIDTKIFITGGKSLHFRNVGGKNISTGFSIPEMKPNTKYRLTYFLRTDKLTGKQGAGVFLYFNKTNGRCMPHPQVLGTTSWHRLSFEFKSPANTGVGRKPTLGLWIWQAAGEAWFDDVRIEECP